MKITYRSYYRFCNKCGKEVTKNAEFCKHCGHKILTPVKNTKKQPFCSYCGKEVSKKAEYCKHCGEKLYEEPEEEEVEEPEEEPEEEEEYKCEYCGKKFSSEVVYLKHEKKCSEKEEEKPQYIGKETVTEELKRSSWKKWAVIIIIIIVIGTIYVVNQGSFESAIQVDPCQREYDRCKRDCGEGLIAAICKEGCAIDYRECRS